MLDIGIPIGFLVDPFQGIAAFYVNGGQVILNKRDAVDGVVKPALAPSVGVPIAPSKNEDCRNK